MTHPARTSIAPLQGEFRMPGDKSISHRTLIFGALGQGESRIRGLSGNADVLATRDCLTALGVPVITDGEEIRIGSPDGYRDWRAPQGELDCMNAGTAMRLLSGLLVAQPFASVLTGDASLRKRPMGRVIEPLSLMGANIEGSPCEGKTGNQFAPLSIGAASASGLRGIAYNLPVASAQVKSAILLAGLFAEGETRLTEPAASRDHTERMFAALGITLQIDGDTCRLPGGQIDQLQASDFLVPGDPSSAAFFVVAALCIPGSSIRLPDINLNPGRTGLIDALKTVGADIRIENERLVCGEPLGDLVVNASELKGKLRIAGDLVPALIDEIPILAVIGVFLNGQLIVQNAEELRHKESDRIETVVNELAKLGIPVAATPDGFVMEGPLTGKVQAPSAVLSSHHDHRIAMMLRVLNRAVSTEDWPMDGEEWTSVSFPGFRELLYR